MRQAADEQRKEVDALRLTTAEYQALQSKRAGRKIPKALDAIRAELADTRADLTKERERRKQAETDDALRARVRRDTLEQLLTQLWPNHADSSSAPKIRQPNDFTDEIRFYGAFLHMSRLNPCNGVLSQRSVRAITSIGRSPRPKRAMASRCASNSLYGK